MTSSDDTARTIMRAYADTLTPPPVADVIARAERAPDAPPSPVTARPRPRGRLVLASASAAAAAAAAAITVINLIVSQPPDRDATAAIPPTTSTAVARAAPGCPPGLPLLDGPHDIEGRRSTPIQAKAGQPLTLPSQIQATDPDRPLLTFKIYLTPPGPHGIEDKPAHAVATSPVLQLKPDHQRVAPVVPIPAGLTPGTYNIVGYGTYPAPSLCGVKNPAASSAGHGTIRGVLGWVVIN